MVHPRRLCPTQLSSGALGANVLNHLQLPSDCIISLSAEDDREPMAAATHSFYVEVISSKLTGAGSSGGSNPPRSMLLSLYSSWSCLHLWPRGVSRCAWALEHDRYGSEGERPTISLSLSFAKTVGIQITQALDRDILEDSNWIGEAIWPMLHNCTQLRSLSFSDNGSLVPPGGDYRL